MNTKKQLAIFLSRLQSFDKPSLRLEQYPTDSEIAAEVIWHAQLAGDIEDKTMADLGCGTGILGIGCMFFEPEKVFFVDIDKYTLKRLEENIKLQDFESDFEIINSNISKFNTKVDVVIQNPPFGTKDKHADKFFLEKAFEIADVVYSFHKLSTKVFVEAIAKDHGFKITNMFKFSFPLKKTQAFHTKDLHRIEVGCWRMEKIKKQ